MFKRLLERYANEDRKMVAEAVRLSSDTKSSTHPRLTAIFWFGVVIAGSALLFLLRSK
jgi:hypothetical protein